MKLFRSNILLADEAAGTTGGTSTESKPEPKPTPTPAGAKEAPAADALSAKVKEFEEVMADNRAIFDATKSPEERESAARRHFARLGYTRAQIDQWVTDNVTGAEEPAPQPKGSTNDGSPDPEVKELKAELSRVQTQQLNDKFKQSLDKQMLESPEIKNLLTAAKRLRGDKDLPKVRELIEKTLKQEALRNIKIRMDRTGERLSPDWIPDEVERAVRSAVEQHSAVIGDPSAIGKSSETSVQTDPFAGRTRAKAPAYAAGKTLGEIESEAVAWMTDELVDLASKVPSSKGESKA